MTLEYIRDLTSTESTERHIVHAASLGIIKIVNAVTDKEQAKYQRDDASSKPSMSSVAFRLKFPQHVIIQRNKITHSWSLPDLDRLKSMYIDIYKWLYIERWSPLCDRYSDEMEQR